MAQKKANIGLGRGLGALLSPQLGSPLAKSKEEKSSPKPTSKMKKPGALPTGAEAGAGEERSFDRVHLLDIHLVERSPDQPRRHFDETALEELSSSIREHGILQPILVKPSADGKSYRIIAGERRWRAALQAGLDKIPALLRPLSEEEIFLQALIENLQREDLQPLEEARALRRIQETGKFTQEELAQKVGKSRPAVANALRLLSLPPSVLPFLEEGKLSAGHARALLALPDETVQLDLARLIVDQQLSVRETERWVQDYIEEEQQRKVEPSKESAASTFPDALELAIRQLETELTRSYGLRVSLKERKNHSGSLIFHYKNAKEREALLEALKKNS